MVAIARQLQLLVGEKRKDKSGQSRAHNRGAPKRKSYTLVEKQAVVTFYLQRCRERGEVLTEKNHQTHTLSALWMKLKSIFMDIIRAAPSRHGSDPNGFF